MTLETCEVKTPLGALTLFADGSHLVGVEFGDKSKGKARLRRTLERAYGDFDVKRVKDPAGAATRLRRYFAGDAKALDDQPVRGHGTPFQQAVWKALRAIPAGTTRSYGELAKTIGRPSSVRAVGAANGANPVAIFVPCHRIVASDGSAHGYGGGIARKEWLLEHEGARSGAPSRAAKPRAVRS